MLQYSTTLTDCHLSVADKFNIIQCNPIYGGQTVEECQKYFDFCLWAIVLTFVLFVFLTASKLLKIVYVMSLESRRVGMWVSSLVNLVCINCRRGDCYEMQYKFIRRSSFFGDSIWTVNCWLSCMVFSNYVYAYFLFTARCTLVQSAVLRSHVVCLSVCLSVCDVGELWSHRLEFFKNNFTIS